jgi:hypothetical protein
VVSEIAVRVPVSFGVPLRSLDEAFRLSQNLGVAEMLPKDLRGKPSDILAMLLYGQELGLGPMQSIQSIYVVEGRPSLSAQLWRALVRRAGHKFRMVERIKNVSCTVEIERHDDPGNPHRETFTINDAIQTKKVSLKDGQPYARSQSGKPLPWELFTDDLLAARATARACRFACPEVALGFYDEGEAEEIAEAEMPTPFASRTGNGTTLGGVPVDDRDVNLLKDDETVDAEVVPDDTKVADEVRDLAAEFTPPTDEERAGWPPLADMVDEGQS